MLQFALAQVTIKAPPELTKFGKQRVKCAINRVVQPGNVQLSPDIRLLV